MNRFREWLSDNLRYILLILGIVVILIGLFFGARAITNAEKGAKSDATGSSSVSSITQETAASSAEQSSESAAETTPDAASAEISENADPGIISVIDSYYEARGSGDADAVEKLVDTLSDDERNAIGEESRTYSDVTVYTTASPEQNGSIVYATYTYKEPGQIISLPGIDQFYVRQNGSAWQIVLSDPDSEVLSYISSLRDSNAAVGQLYDVTDQLFTAAAQAEQEAQSAVESAKSDAESAASDAVAAAQSEAAEAQSRAEAAEAQNAAESEEASQAEEAGQSDETPASESSRQEDSYSANAKIVSPCYMRSAAAYGDNIIASLAAGDSVQVLTRDIGWSRIRLSDGTVGYVATKFLSGN